MWEYLRNKFDGYPSQTKVVEKIISLGLSVVPNLDGQGSLKCDNIDITAASFARSLSIDRRVVLEVLNKIVSDPSLRDFFQNLKPVANLGKVSSDMGLGVIQIVPESASKPGIISAIASIIARENISIRQVIVDDPELVSEPKALIVTDSKIPPNLLPEMRNVPGVMAVVIL